MASILVVDDDADLRAILSAVLEHEGHAATEAGTGEEALRATDTSRFDVVLADVEMPGMSGIRLVEALRGRLSVPVIMVTAHARLDVALACLRAGAFDFVEKPVEPARVTTAVRRALAFQRLRANTALYEASQALFAQRDPDAIVESLSTLGLRVLHADSVTVLGPDGAIWRASGVAGAAARDGHVLSGSLAGPAGPIAEVVATRRAGRPRFSEEDGERMGILVTQAALALDNAGLMASLRERLEALERARVRLTAAERLEAVGELGAGLAHQIQNPVSYVQAQLRAAEEALGPHAPEEVRRSLAEALEGVRRISLLARDVGALARGRTDVVVDLAAVVEAARRLAGGRVRVGVECAIPPVDVRGHPGDLAQAVIHLLVNASRAMGDDPSRTVRVEATTHGDVVWLDVVDEGPGVPEDVRSHVFEPFFSTWGSTGLGLSTVADVAARSGGRASLVEQSGPGARFRIVLPVVAAREDELFGEADEG
ncbi:MAG: response regulator [Myxococcota bacterium]